MFFVSAAIYIQKIHQHTFCKKLFISLLEIFHYGEIGLNASTIYFFGAVICFGCLESLVNNLMYMVVSVGTGF
jgi:hypothetical protein